MNLAAAGIMLLYFAGTVGYSMLHGSLNVDLHDARFLLKLIISGGGAGYLVYTDFDKLKSLFKQTNKVVPDVPKIVDNESKYMTDYTSLVYLKNRAQELKSQEMMELVVKLNNLLFSLSVDKQ